MNNKTSLTAIFNFLKNMNGMERSVFLLIFSVSLWLFISYILKKNWSDKDE